MLLDFLPEFVPFLALTALFPSFVIAFESSFYPLKPVFVGPFPPFVVESHELVEPF